MSPQTPKDPEQGEAAEAEQSDADAAEQTEADAQELKTQGGEAPSTPAPQAAKAPKPARKRRKAAAGKDAPAAQGKDAPPADQPASASKPKRRQRASGAGEGGAKERAAAAPDAAKEPRRPVLKRGKAPAAGRSARRRVVRARARYVRTSARKARMVCGHLRGKSVQDARAILAFTPREVARDWSKLLESAVANAESNHELLEDDLIVREAYADEGPTIKRFRPRAMGRATPIRKRTSHLTITLSPRA